MLRVTVRGRGISPNAVHDFPFWVRNYGEIQEEDQSIKVNLNFK